MKTSEILKAINSISGTTDGIEWTLSADTFDETPGLIYVEVECDTTALLRGCLVADFIESRLSADVKKHIKFYDSDEANASARFEEIKS